MYHLDDHQPDHACSVRVAARQEATIEVSKNVTAVPLAVDVRRNILLCFAEIGQDD